MDGTTGLSNEISIDYQMINPPKFILNWPCDLKRDYMYQLKLEVYAISCQWR